MQGHAFDLGIQRIDEFDEGHDHLAGTGRQPILGQVERGLPQAHRAGAGMAADLVDRGRAIIFFLPLFIWYEHKNINLFTFILTDSSSINSLLRASNKNSFFFTLPPGNS